MKSSWTAEFFDFVQAHLKEDPHKLILQGKKYPNIDLKEAVVQITGRKKGGVKLPEWTANPRVIFPPAISLEQCSSQQTAEYKAAICSYESVLDLTGGFGIDTFYFSKKASKATYVERQEVLMEIAKHNFEALGASHIEVIHGESEAILANLPVYDLLYIDPARRDDINRKLYKLEDCSPNVVALLPRMKEKAKQILIKASPMTDLQQALVELGQVTKVFILAVQNDCKELLFLIDQKTNNNPSITTINFTKEEAQEFTFSLADESEAEVGYSFPKKYLYEPNVAVLKAGAFRIVCQKFGLAKLHQNSHLYTSEELNTDFPGRLFKVKEILKANKKIFKQYYPDGKVNVIMRNYPVKANQFKTQYRLQDGGETYLIGTTLQDGRATLLACERLK